MQFFKIDQKRYWRIRSEFIAHAVASATLRYDLWALAVNAAEWFDRTADVERWS